MSRTKLNILANFIGQSWSALMGLAFVPLYIRFIGIEAYGLIGFYATLQGALQILDFGVSPTMNREMARYSTLPESAGEARDFVRTLEFAYWALGIIIGVVIWAAAPLIAIRWIKADSLPVDVIRLAIRTMGVVFAFQWPLSFYQGGLMGLQRQTVLNGINIAAATLKNGGAVLILWLVSSTVTAFFVWLIVVSTLQVALTTIFLWRNLPASDHPPRFVPSLLRRVWRFAAGMSGITFSGLILTQLDKVILSKLLSLEMFGYYNLAGVAVNGLRLFVVPIFNALFPRFSELATVGDQASLKKLYHRSSQFLAMIIWPSAAVLALFAFDILLLWTGDIETARKASLIVSLLTIGSAINGLMHLPYALQLAHGWTSLGLRIGLFLIIVLVPTTFFMTIHYGAVGGAAAWVISNGIYLLIGVPLTHRRLLRGEMWQWLGEDVGLPFIGAMVIAGIGRRLIISPMTPVMALINLSAILFGSWGAAVLVGPQTRAWIGNQLSKAKLARA